MSTVTATGAVRRNRTPLLLGIGVLVLLLVISLVSRDDARFGGDLDPRNPRPDGAQAVAKVLAEHGVDVLIVRGRSAFARAAIDPDTTVLVTNTDALGASTLRELRSRSEQAGAVVLAADAASVIDGFDLRTRALGGADLPARCPDPLANDLTVRAPYSVGIRGPGCFGSRGTVLLNRPDDRYWLLSAPRLLSNREVLKADNAALALRLLGQHDRLVWYVADAADTTSSDAVSITTLLPRWLLPALWVLGFAVLALVLWRGRRFGPLVREPLPVVIRAVESTESRGRLYHRSRDRTHAAAILRAATIRRLAVQLALPADTAVSHVIAATAARCGRPVPEVAALLMDSPVVNDSRLADLGRQLLRLEAEVRTR